MSTKESNPVRRALIYIWGVNVLILLILILLYLLSTSTPAVTGTIRVVEDVDTGCQYLVNGGAMYPRLEPGTRKQLCFALGETRVRIEQGKKTTEQKKSS